VTDGLSESAELDYEVVGMSQGDFKWILSSAYRLYGPRDGRITVRSPLPDVVVGIGDQSVPCHIGIIDVSFGNMGGDDVADAGLP